MLSLRCQLPSALLGVRPTHPESGARSSSTTRPHRRLNPQDFETQQKGRDPQGANLGHQQQHAPQSTQRRIHASILTPDSMLKFVLLIAVAGVLGRARGQTESELL
jgi:hypothetical protein